MKSFRNIRVIPVAVTAIFCLAVLKIAGLVLEGGYVFAHQPARSWAQENLNFPGANAVKKEEPSDVTGSVEGKPKEPAKEDAPKPEAPDTKSEGIVIHPEDNQSPVSPSERAVLERLQARRQELDARAREIDIRENLLKAAEKRIDSKVEQMKAAEARIATAGEQKAEAENARFKGIVTMYEGMKPKDAAKVFDRLEMPVLIEIASQIAPRKMSDILGVMSPEAAERLTVEMARRANGGDQSALASDLPKIDGKPTQKPN